MNFAINHFQPSMVLVDTKCKWNIVCLDNLYDLVSLLNFKLKDDNNVIDLEILKLMKDMYPY